MASILGKREHSPEQRFDSRSLRDAISAHWAEIDSNQLLIGDWDVSDVQDMDELFKGMKNFNQPLPWDTRSVKSMNGTFRRCSAFNQPLAWDTSSVRDMNATFTGCSSFNTALDWDTSSVTDMGAMFWTCSALNAEISFKTQNVEDMSSMFAGNTVFNAKLVGFDTGRVRTMASTFTMCEALDQPLAWDTKNVEDMSRTFSGCTLFSQTLNWDMRSVTDAEDMFLGSRGSISARKCLNSDGLDRARKEGTAEEECSVCYDYTGRYKMPCGHAFCGTCLERIFTFPDLQKTCPLCRAPISLPHFEDRLFFGAQRWPLATLLRILDEATTGAVTTREVPAERHQSSADSDRCDLYARKAVCHLRRADASTSGAAHVARAREYARKAVCVRCGDRATRRYELGTDFGSSISLTVSHCGHHEPSEAAVREAFVRKGVHLGNVKVLSERRAGRSRAARCSVRFHFGITTHSEQEEDPFVDAANAVADELFPGHFTAEHVHASFDK